MKKHFPFLLLLLFAAGKSYGQSAYVPYDPAYYHMIDRLEILSGKFSGQFHSGIKPIQRHLLATFVDSFQIAGTPISKRDFDNLGYLQTDNLDYSATEKGQNSKKLLRYFYPTRIALFSQKDNDYQFYLNPILNLWAGRDFKTGENLYTNTRGIELRGDLGKKIGFYSYLTENQVRAPQYVRDQVNISKVYPGAGLTKDFTGNAYDYLQARGYITFTPVKQVTVQFGHDRNFIGDGIRSLILSDFGKDYLFLKLNTRFWRVNYQNLFQEHVSYTNNGNRSSTSKKYAATHYLNVNVTRNLNIGLFETIVFDRSDSNGNNQGFDLNYANPIIFYRAVEHGLNSSDNALLGATFKWNFLRHFSLYGQMVLDEFVLKEYRNNRGWWGNKYGYQAGLKYIDAFFIKNLDLQLETNKVRPYTYMHSKRSQGYIHFNQPLAHPLGANFTEYLAILRYQPGKKLFLTCTFMYAKKGLDSDSTNWGGNIITKTYMDRVQNYGNVTGQGEKTTIMTTELNVCYRIYHNIFLDMNLVLRDVDTPLKQVQHSANYLSLGFRMNIARQQLLY